MATRTVGADPRQERDFIEAVKKKASRPSLLDAHRRFLIYGRNKKGKTTFGMSAGVEKTLVIDPEHGTDAFLKNNPYVIHVERWEDLQDVAGALRTGKLSPKLLGLGTSTIPYEWVLLDGLTRINNMALRYIMNLGEATSLTRKPGVVDRRDYGKSGELLKELLIKFQALPLNVCYTCHERMITTEDDADDEETDGTSYYYVPDLPAGPRSVINGLVEVIGRVYTAKVTVKGNDITQRRLYIGQHDKYDTGFRSDFVPPTTTMIKRPTIPKLVSLMKGESATG